MIVRLAIVGATLLGEPAFADPLRSCLPYLAENPVSLQQQDGHVTCVNRIVTATAGALVDGRVGKAALILPLPRMAVAGDLISVSAEVFVPQGQPRTSIHLMDLECKFCGLPGNPGLRLYLRDGRLRIDRAKIDAGHAWTNDTAPRVPTNRWVRLEWQLTVSAGQAGGARVKLDGVEVLAARGRTVPLGPDAAGVDRLQIGVTANSNDRPATVRLRNVRLTGSVGADG